MKNFYKNFNIIFSISMFFIFLLGAGQAVWAQEKVKEVKIVAVVNDEVITSHDLDKSMVYFRDQLRAILDPEKRQATEKKGRMNVLEDLIRDRLLDQEMKRLEIRVSEAEIDDEWKKMVKRSGVGEERFREELLRQKISFDEYRKSLGDHIRLLKFISRRIRSKVSIGEEDIRNFYQRSQSEFAEPDRLRLLQVSMPSQTPAKELQALRFGLARGFESHEDFSRRYPGARLHELGVMDVKDLGEEARSVVEKLGAGEVSRHVRGKGGFVIFKVLEKIPGKAVPLEEIKEQLQVKLYEKEIERELDAYLANLRRTAHVEIRL